jgi:hypothetical protein
MRKEITNPVGKWWVVANRCGDLHVTDGDMPERAGSGWQGMNNDYEWTSATDDVFKTVLFQLLRLIKAHYNLRLMNS